MVTDLGSLFNQYSLQTRLYPAFLSASPVVITVALLWTKSPATGLWPLLVGMGFLFFLATWVRGRGQEVEERLVRVWSGMPTTHMLRQAEGNSGPQFLRRRELLTAVTGIQLPSASQEAQNPSQADEVYVMATKTLIARILEKRSLFQLVHQENIHYGFRRNLYAMKPLALTLLFANLIFDASWLVFVGVIVAGVAALVVHLLLLVAWFVIVDEDWVRKQGDTYAARLFSALEDSRLGRIS